MFIFIKKYLHFLCMRNLRRVRLQHLCFLPTCISQISIMYHELIYSDDFVGGANIKQGSISPVVVLYNAQFNQFAKLC